jgi:hypothetical protein
MYLMPSAVSSVKFSSELSGDRLQVHEVAEPGADALAHFVLT